MKVVLFCDGVGWRYYTRYGHKKFILHRDDKAEVIRHYFRSDEVCVSSDLVLTAGGKNLELW
jgi:hypothetical protein